MMKYTKPAIAALFAISMISSGAAHAQFGGLKNAVKREAKKTKRDAEKEAVKEAEKAINKAIGGTTGTSSRSRKSNGSATLGKPSSSLTSLTKCTGLALSNVTVGNLGSYTFQQGFSKEKRTGFINRKPGKISGSCIAPSLQPQEILYFEVDEKKYKALNKGNDWTWQCVKSDNPSAGTTNYWTWNSDQYLGDSHMKLHCGNDQGVSDCATGSNSSRASAYTADRKKRGKYGISFMARLNEHSNARTEKLYCQYYNKRSGQSLVGFEYLSAPAR
ncbi:hypothetical protein [Parasphingorhabdus sp.]|uniref:hypothetical protein n=2 Tax=Parasphingorhabdus sp. TaxID=2709688 RepID=UPI0032638A39